MSKFSEEFKLRVVKQYLAGNAGYVVLARSYGIQKSHVSKWVAAYRQHGAAGVAKKFQHYNASYRLQVLHHMWDNGLSYAQTAAVFDIRSQGCLAAWERCYHEGGIEALSPRKRGKPPKMSNTQTPQPLLPGDDQNLTREELLAEINQLRMENAYLKKLDALIQSQQLQRSTVRKKRK